MCVCGMCVFVCVRMFVCSRMCVCVCVRVYVFVCVVNIVYCTSCNTTSIVYVVDPFFVCNELSCFVMVRDVCTLETIVFRWVGYPGCHSGVV